MTTSELSHIRSGLRAMQQADGMFPSGGFAFSGGLESALNDRLLASASDIEAFILDQIRFRWASFDRPVVCRAHQCAGDHESVFALDHEVDAMTLTEALRDGSRRNGQALLTSLSRLSDGAVAEYRRAVLAEQTPGHLAVVQGMAWATLGITPADAQAASAYAMASGLTSAAVRLGVLGALDAQRVLMGAMDEIALIVSNPVDVTRPLTAYTPAAEIAAMRHGQMAQRLFSN